jgi:hypothetical protein
VVISFAEQPQNQITPASIKSEKCGKFVEEEPAISGIHTRKAKATKSSLAQQTSRYNCKQQDGTHYLTM